MRLIDADALTVELMDSDLDHLQRDDWKEIIQIVADAPTIEQPQWIQVSERLPEELAEVNITWINTNPEPYYDFIKDKPATGSAVYYKGRWYWYSAVCTDYLREYGCSPYDEMDDAIKVLAWMPLPKAYKVTK